MQKTGLKKSLSLIVCMVLIAALALFTTGCNDNNNTDPDQTGTTGAATVLGVGEKEFRFTVTDGDGKETAYEIHTDHTTVGNALLSLDLIKGENSQYGLFIKTVTGITVDFDKDGKYWAFYINGEYAMAGVDTTEIVNGATYSLKVE